MQRREVYFSGRVQGVGFRYQTLTIAQRYDVTGYVENLADGRVRLLAEGNVEELDRFLDDIQQAMAGNIQSIQTDQRPASGTWGEFSIRH